MSELDFIEKCEDELNELDDFIVHMNNMFEKIRLEQYHIIKLYYAKQHLEQNEKIQNEHEIINYNDKHYVVIKLKHLNKTKLTVIDFDDFDKIKYIKWCYMSNGYIFTRVYINWKLEFPIYLHNLIMNQIKFTSDKTGKSVDHINRIPLDNRKENLRLINQTDQNFNQNRKARTVRLPDNCNIKSIEIPRSVSYSKARGIGGEYFEVWLPNFNNQDLRWSSSRDKTLSLKFKLEQTKKYLRYLQNKYPEEINKRHIETEYNDNEIKVIESYNAIIKLSKFYDQTMEIKYNQINYLKEDLTNLTETEIKLLNNLNYPHTFWRIIPFPSLAADQKNYKADGEYWLGSVWAPTNVMIIKGLDKFGVGNDLAYKFNEFATLATEEYLNGIYEVYNKTGTIWENYSPEALARGSWSRPDFVGWTGCGPIELLIENIIGLRPDGVNSLLIWHLTRIDKHGIENLIFGNVTVSLSAEKREKVTSPITIKVICDNDFKLNVEHGNNNHKVIKLTKGEHTLIID